MLVPGAPDCATDSTHIRVYSSRQYLNRLGDDADPRRVSFPGVAPISTGHQADRLECPGYARVDKHLRPTRKGDLRLSMIYTDLGKAAQAASLYERLLPDEKQRFAKRYLICLLDRGYSLWPVESPDRALQQAEKAGATER